MKTLTARFPGTCRGCPTAIEPGDKIVNRGRGRNFHAACDGNGVTEIYFPSTGKRMYVNNRGRCEDAPCCGCCTFG